MLQHRTGCSPRWPRQKLAGQHPQRLLTSPLPLWQHTGRHWRNQPPAAGSPLPAGLSNPRRSEQGWMPTQAVPAAAAEARRSLLWPPPLPPQTWQPGCCCSRPPSQAPRCCWRCWHLQAKLRQRKPQLGMRGAGPPLPWCHCHLEPGRLPAAPCSAAAAAACARAPPGAPAATFGSGGGPLQHRPAPPAAAARCDGRRRCG